MISVQDLRFAVRSLRSHAGTMGFATLTLACGLAAALAILTVVDTLLLRALPYPNAERVVELLKADYYGRYAPDAELGAGGELRAAA